MTSKNFSCSIFLCEIVAIYLLQAACVLHSHTRAAFVLLVLFKFYIHGKTIECDECMPDARTDRVKVEIVMKNYIFTYLRKPDLYCC